jgi:hypothetical protein
MSLVSASSSVFCNHFLFSFFIWFLKLFTALLAAFFVSEEIELVSNTSCLDLIFQAWVVLRECCIFVFYCSFAFSESHAIFADLWVALSRAS